MLNWCWEHPDWYWVCAQAGQMNAPLLEWHKRSSTLRQRQRLHSKPPVPSNDLWLPLIKLRLLYGNRRVMLPWHTICCTMWRCGAHTAAWNASQLSPIAARSEMRVRDSGGSLGSSHSVTSLNDCRRTHSIFHSSAVDSASALSLVTQEYPESAQSEKKNSLSHFSWLLRCCFCIISTDVFK